MVSVLSLKLRILKYYYFRCLIISDIYLFLLPGKLNIKVKGSVVDDHTRCTHHHSSLDIIAIRMKCCNEYYPCISCHREAAGHAATAWPANEFDTKAVLCGECYNEMTITEYLQSSHQCPFCKAPFNPGCSNHYHYYFAVDSNE